MTSTIDVVNAYASAKSARDVDAVLALCADDAVLETVPYGTRATGHDEIRLQLSVFYEAFPDYRIERQGAVADGDTVMTWGEATATMQGPVLGIEPTGKGYRVPYACLYRVRGPKVTLERFYFDLHDQCEQLGVPTALVAERMREARAALEGAG